MADRVTFSLDQTASALWEKLKPEIEKTYSEGGRSEFLRDMLMRYAEDRTELEIRKQVVEDRISRLKDELSRLEDERDMLQQKIDEIQPEEEEQALEIDEDELEEFWDRTMQKIMVQERNDPTDINRRFNQWFDGRHTLYKNKFASISKKRFKEKLLDEAETRGYGEKVQKLS